MTSSIEVPTASAAATKRVAAKLGSLLSPPVVLALSGPLGAGKTTFVQGLVAALPGGSALRVQSPTFALARTYPTTPPVHHLDLYRLDDEDAARDLGLFDLVADERALSCVEWAERAPAIMDGGSVLFVRFPANASRRRRLSLAGPVADRLLEVADEIRAASQARG